MMAASAARTGAQRPAAPTTRPATPRPDRACGARCATWRRSRAQMGAPAAACPGFRPWSPPCRRALPSQGCYHCLTKHLSMTYTNSAHVRPSSRRINSTRSVSTLRSLRNLDRSASRFRQPCRRSSVFSSELKSVRPSTSLTAMAPHDPRPAWPCGRGGSGGSRRLGSLESGPQTDELPGRVPDGVLAGPGPRSLRCRPPAAAAVARAEPFARAEPQQLSEPKSEATIDGRSARAQLSAVRRSINHPTLAMRTMGKASIQAAGPGRVAVRRLGFRLSSGAGPDRVCASGHTVGTGRVGKGR